MSSPDVCCICLDGYDDKHQSTCFACGHRMHTVCMRQYIRASMNTNSMITTCPMCRRPIMDDDLPSSPTPTQTPNRNQTIRSVHRGVVMPIIFATNNSVIQIEDRENERSAQNDYRWGVACTIALMIMILFIKCIMISIEKFASTVSKARTLAWRLINRRSNADTPF